MLQNASLRLYVNIAENVSNKSCALLTVKMFQCAVLTGYSLTTECRSPSPTKSPRRLHPTQMLATFLTLNVEQKV